MPDLQPKGTLNLTVDATLPQPGGLTFPYSRLADQLAEVNKAIGTANNMILGSYMSELSPYKHTIEGVIFSYPKSRAGKAKIEIAAASGVKALIADGSGRIKLTLDKALLAENPKVTMSEKPQYIVPDMPHF